MDKPIKTILNAKGHNISIQSSAEADYISLTDIAKYKSRKLQVQVEHFGKVEQ